MSEEIAASPSEPDRLEEIVDQKIETLKRDVTQLVEQVSPATVAMEYGGAVGRQIGHVRRAAGQLRALLEMHPVFAASIAFGAGLVAGLTT